MSSDLILVDLVKRPSLLGRATDLVRRLVAVLLGGLLAGIGWLVVMQESFKRGLTDHDYNKVMAQVVTEAGGEDTARVGYRVTLVAGVILAAIFALAVHRLTRDRSGFLAAALFAVVPFLAWGLLLAPLVDARRRPLAGRPGDPIPGGVLGLDAGAATPLAALAASYLAALIVVRTYRLMTTAAWWTTRETAQDGTAGELSGLVWVEPGSLELPEQRSEQAGEGSRG